MAPTTPPRRFRDPNEIFQSIGGSAPASTSTSQVRNDETVKAATTTTTTTTPSPRLKSISKRLMARNSILRRGSPPGSGGGRTPILARRKSSKRKPNKLDVGYQQGPYDNINVRERVRKWQANGGGVIDASNPAPYVPPPRPAPTAEKRLVAEYSMNDYDDMLETSSARAGFPPLALPPPPPRSLFSQGKRSSMSSLSGREDGESGSNTDTPSKNGNNNHPAMRRSPSLRTRRKARRKRVPKSKSEGELKRAASKREQSPISKASDDESKAVSAVSLTIESAPVSPSQNRTSEVSATEPYDERSLVRTADSPPPPPPPPHASSSVGTPSTVVSQTDDGIRVKSVRKRLTRQEREERHRQRQLERQEMLERERTRVREEELQRIREEQDLREQARLREQERERIREQERQYEIERLREEERLKEIERIRDQERKRILEEERLREEERTRQREVLRKKEEARKKREQEREERRLEREREREERRKEREKERERARERERERIREEERAKAREEARLEQERERIRLEEQRQLEREEEKHKDIMWEIQQAEERGGPHGQSKRNYMGLGSPSKQQKRDKEVYDAVEKRLDHNPFQSREQMQDAIKLAVKEVMSEMVGEIIIEDEHGVRNFRDRSTDVSAEHPASSSNTSHSESQGRSTRDTTPEMDWKMKNFLSSAETAPSEAGSNLESTYSTYSTLEQAIEEAITPSLHVARELPPKPVPQIVTSSVEIIQEANDRSESPQEGSGLRRSLRTNTAPPRPRRRAVPSTIIEEEGSSKATSPSTSQAPSRSNTANSRRSGASVSTLRSSAISKASSALGTSDSSFDNSGDGYFTSVHEPIKRGGSQKFTSHADLISILSESREARPKSIRSVKSTARSVRSARSVKSTRSTRSGRSGVSAAKSKASAMTLTINDLMDELVKDEAKYMEDLARLIDGVIPTLVQNVLAQSDSNVAAGLHRAPSLATRQARIKPVVDMGITLERMRHTHAKLPRRDVDALLKWAQSAKSVYNDYLNCWRLGYEDTYVAVASENGTDQVDVAHLLKRPLVRTRVLTKLFKRLNYMIPSESPLQQETAPLLKETALQCFNDFQSLVSRARQKVAEEKARLEDEAAACIDASKARDLRTLEMAYGIIVDPHFRVRARDYFTMQVRHSSNTSITCYVELYIRDDRTKLPDIVGELMVCEVHGDEKWLLFQPIPLEWITVSAGKFSGEWILSVKGRALNHGNWEENLRLSADPAISLEWMQMLGSAPEDILAATRLPVSESTPEGDSEANLNHLLGAIDEQMKSFCFDNNTSNDEQQKRQNQAQGDQEPQEHEQDPEQDPEQEMAPECLIRRFGSIKREDSPPPPQPTPQPMRRPRKIPLVEVVVIPNYLDAFDGGQMVVPYVAGGFGPRHEAEMHYAYKQPVPPPPDSEIYPGSSISCHRIKQVSGSRPARQPPKMERSRSITPTPKNSATVSFNISQTPPSSPGYDRSEASSRGDEESGSGSENHSDEEGSISQGSDGEDESSAYEASEASRASRSTYSHRSMRSSEASGVTHSSYSRSSRRSSSASTERPASVRGSEMHEEEEEEEEGEEEEEEGDEAPPVPMHRSTPSTTGSQAPQNSSRNDARVDTSQLRPPHEVRRKRSSPLKHEYAPSSITSVSEKAASEASATEGEEEGGQSGSSAEDSGEEDSYSGEESGSGSGSGSEHSHGEEDGSEEEYSDEEADEKCPELEDEDGDLPGPMISTLYPTRSMYSAPIGGNVPSRVSSRAGSQSPSNENIAPVAPVTSDAIPATSANQAAFKGQASVYVWAPAGFWDRLHPDECAIIAFPGQLQVISPSRTMPDGRQLFSLDLKPVTPIRRTTALDLLVKSAQDSKFAGASIMFRSGTARDCESLYNAINSAKLRAENIHGFASRSHSLRRQGSYRAMNVNNNQSNPSISIGAAPSIISTESSMGSLSSAFSVLKGSLRGSIFGGHGRSNSGSWMSSSSTSDGLQGPRGIINPTGGIPITGIGGETPYEGTGYVSNLRIHLHKRESVKKWQTLGSARLSVITPPPGQSPRGGGVIASNPHVKRIVVRDKKGQTTLLDEVLNESCFERIARTGIAVSVPSADDGVVQANALGGGHSRGAVYMLQFKSEKETVETFNIVGRLRY